MIEMGMVSGGLGAARHGWAFVQYLRDLLSGDMLSALYDHNGVRLEGSDKIVVEVHRKDDGPIYWYSVEQPEGFAFIREPVVPSCCHELVGTIAGEANPDSRYWRWVAPVLPGRIYGSEEPANIKTNFFVFAYRPSALLKAHKTKK